MSKQKQSKQKEKRGPLGTPQDFINKVYENPYKSERIDMENGLIALKYPIRITKDRLAILEKICETMEVPNVGVYIAQALYEKMDSDLHNPMELGKAFCDSLLREWEVNNDKNNHTVLLCSTQK
jgi:hypothetical protein